jgi:hypothetical protein
MPKIRAHFSLLLVPLAVAAGSGAMAHKTPSDAISCEIRSSKSSGGILLEAVATGQAQTTGEYEFVISKSGGGGTSDITQGGEFEIGPEEEVILGEVALGSGEGTSVRARLTLSEGGKVLCEAQVPKRN